LNPPNYIPRAPVSPPPFGQPAGHIGGSYDWWWWSIGRLNGAPYQPTVEVPGGYWVWGRGCTEPGGGIQPAWGFVKNGTNPPYVSTPPRDSTGFGVGETVAPPAYSPPSPWAMGIATSVVGAAVGWAIEEIAVHVRGRRRR
jgi:hypothetical protein